MSTISSAFVSGPALQPGLVPSNGSTWGIDQGPVARRRVRPGRTVVRSSLTEGQQAALTAAAVPALPVVAYSEFVLGTTGCGLPPGPGGLLGAAEGVSYLIVVALVALSAWTKLRTGKGLPAGPAGFLGAAEGLAFLLAVVGIVDAAYVAYAYGGLPSAVPIKGSRCFAP